MLSVGHYGLGGGLLDLRGIGGPIAFQRARPGSAGTTIDAQHTNPVLEVFGQAQIVGVTIARGQALNGSVGATGQSGGDGGFGGGILNDGTPTLTDAAVTGNASGVPTAARGPTSRNELRRPDRRSQ